MKNEINNCSNDWLDEFIFEEGLSNESIYAVHNFMQHVSMQFEMRAFHKIRSHIREREENNRWYRYPDTGDPF